MSSCRLKPETLEERLAQRIAPALRCVLRKDLQDLGGYDQIGQSLRELVRQGRLMKMGYGIYARPRPSPIDGAPVPTAGLRQPLCT